MCAESSLVQYFLHQKSPGASVVQPGEQAHSEYDRLAWLGAQTACGYTVVAAMVMGFLCGFTQLLMGSPGDLPETVRAIHERGRIPVNQAPCMFICSAMSITAGMPTSSLDFQPCVAPSASL